MRLSQLLKSSVDAGARFDSLITTKALQKWCIDAGWPSDIVNVLSVINDGSEHTIYYPPYVTARVHDLEYGNQSTPPSYVLRKFLDQIDDGPFAAGMLGGIF